MKRGQRGETSSSKRLRNGGDIDLPLDLTVDILKKLPAKSLVRFLCVSKLWSSIISRSKDFIDSIIARSLTQLPPRDAYFFFHPSPKECYLSFSSSVYEVLVVSNLQIMLGQNVRGLICCWSTCPNKVVVIYNPTTRQSFYLPKHKTLGWPTCFFGYDPIKDQYKALLLDSDGRGKTCQVFTLGDPEEKQWRTIKGIGSYFPMTIRSAVCINGANYFITSMSKSKNSMVTLMSFDVRLEKFYYLLEAPSICGYPTLINYQGKLGLVCCEKGIELWVMEDGKEGTQGWYKVFFHEIEGFNIFRVEGATRDGEIVFYYYGCYPNDMLCVLYYDPKRKSMRYVDLKDLLPEERRPYLACVFPNHVENTMCFY